VKIGKLQRLHNLLVALADFNAEVFSYNSNGPDEYQCAFCGAAQFTQVKTPMIHEKTCIWIEAKQLRKELTDGDSEN
jgi:hypothetical protein